MSKKPTNPGNRGAASKLPSPTQVVSVVKTTGDTLSQFARLRTEVAKTRSTDAECARDMARFQKEDREGQRQFAIKSQESARKQRQADQEHERKLEASRASIRASEERRELVNGCVEGLKTGNLTPEDVFSVASLLGKA